MITIIHKTILKLSDVLNLPHYHQRTAHLLKLSMYKLNAEHKRVHHFIILFDSFSHTYIYWFRKCRSGVDQNSKQNVNFSPTQYTIQLAYKKSLNAPNTPYTPNVNVFSNLLSMAPLLKLQISVKHLLLWERFMPISSLKTVWLPPFESSQSIPHQKIILFGPAGV